MTTEVASSSARHIRSTPARRSALALLVPGVRAAHDVEITPVSLARFPSYDLHIKQWH